MPMDDAERRSEEPDRRQRGASKMDRTNLKRRIPTAREIYESIVADDAFGRRANVIASSPAPTSSVVTGSGTAAGSAYMKSSITTTSRPTVSVGPTGVFPLVMRTRPIRSPALNCTARNDSPLLATGAKNVPRDSPRVSKNWIEVVLERSTSAKTAPKADVKDAAADPGTKKLTSVMLLPSDVKSR